MTDQHNNAPAVPQGAFLSITEGRIKEIASRIGAVRNAVSFARGIEHEFRAMLAATPAPAPAQEPVDMVPRAALHEVERERDWYKTRLQTMHEHQNGQVWYWQGDGEDHPETLVNSLPVVIRADQLRELMAKPEQEVGLTDEVPKGFVPLQRENGKLVYAACLDGGRYHGWLMWMHPDGQWVTKRKMSQMEIMQAEDQEHYGIVQDSGTEALRAKGGK